eukprot:1321810-Alexandrium_andersonii.AAC.1
MAAGHLGSTASASVEAARALPAVYRRARARADHRPLWRPAPEASRAATPLPLHLRELGTVSVRA